MKYRVEVSNEIKDIMPVFLQELEKQLRLLKEGIANGDYSSIQSVSHKIKGSAGSYGFQVLSDMAKQIEHLARNRSSMEEITELYENLYEYYQNSEIVYVDKPL